MPGKLTQAHSKLEQNCANCHDRSNARTQSALCLDCHKPIATDISAQRGYHGRMRNAGQGECRACHSEHKGRDADIVQLDRSQFDHALTDFPLQGAHQSLACQSCHAPGDAWSKASAVCLSCHRRDDVHRGQFTQSCADCHSSLSWAGGRFDHDTTRFKLTGAHQAVVCGACHVGGQYRPTPSSCVGCHATDDVHRGSRGDDCGKCHLTTQWKSARFDHLKETGYALEGAHATLDCLDCHRGGDYQRKLPKDCNGCHAAADAHAGRFGMQCDGCHGSQQWSIAAYDHAGRHHYALLGAHAHIGCHVCHSAPTATQKLGTDCEACHRGESPHGVALSSQCERCHSQDSWRPASGFDHDLTRFPLLGLHRLASCAQCHVTERYDEAPNTCIDCHRGEDVHRGGLGTMCESCHSPVGWNIWSFDHAKQTGFALIGGHSGLGCGDCHREPPGTSKTSSQCVACHRADDRHLGAYGEQCDRCHSVVTWKGARVQ